MLTAQVLVYIIMAFLMGFLTGMLSVMYHPRKRTMQEEVANDSFWLPKSSYLRYMEASEFIQSLQDFTPVEELEQSVDVIAFLKNWRMLEEYDGE